jgi:hypothetical protein
MARSASLPLRLRQRLAAYQWRRVGWLAGISLALSLGLILYLFGAGDQFFSRLFSAFFVWFSLLTVTFLAAIPFIGWATTHWFGPGWSGEDVVVAKRRPTTAPPPTRPAAPRRSSTSTF